MKKYFVLSMLCSLCIFSTHVQANIIHTMTFGLYGQKDKDSNAPKKSSDDTQEPNPEKLEDEAAIHARVLAAKNEAEANIEAASQHGLEANRKMIEESQKSLQIALAMMNACLQKDQPCDIEALEKKEKDRQRLHEENLDKIKSLRQNMLEVDKLKCELIENSDQLREANTLGTEMSKQHKDQKKKLIDKEQEILENCSAYGETGCDILTNKIREKISLFDGMVKTDRLALARKTDTNRETIAKRLVDISNAILLLNSYKELPVVEEQAVAPQEITPTHLVGNDSNPENNNPSDTPDQPTEENVE